MKGSLFIVQGRAFCVFFKQERTANPIRQEWATCAVPGISEGSEVSEFSTMSIQISHLKS